jgi:SRP40, C-terminal domain
MVDQPIAKEKKVPPRPQFKPVQGKKKKGPSKPQPAWLFPPDEENPVLNPREKSHAQVERAIKEREKAVDYMQRRVHGVPDRPAPDPLLLTLIGVFLTDFGFNSTSRLFTNERQARQTLNGWEEALGKKIDKKTPKLEQIFRDWHRDWLVKQDDETSSSNASSDGSSDAESEVGVQLGHLVQDSKEDSGSPSAGSDIEMKDAAQPKKAKMTAKTKKVSSPSPSVSSPSSDSDADDEKEGTAPKKSDLAATGRPSLDEMVSKLKRKAPTGSTKSGLSNPEDERPVKIKKTNTETGVSARTRPAKSSKAAKIKTQAILPDSKGSAEFSTSSASASDDKQNIAAVSAASAASAATSSKKAKAASPPSTGSDTSDPDSDDVGRVEPQRSATLPALSTASSDSSATIHGDSKKSSTKASPSSDPSSSATSSSSSESGATAAALPKTTAPPTTEKIVRTKKHKGAKPTPLGETSESAGAEAHPSNKYQSYNYADRAFKDLSATRGKGFTKEKNKKKRGSYRGGAIDTSGGKSYKFED